MFSDELKQSNENEHSTVDAVYSICGWTLPDVPMVTDLGVRYDNTCKFSFGPHINNIVSKASLRTKLILKCFVTRNPGILCKTFCAFVCPVLEFSSEIWNPYFRWISWQLKTSKDALLRSSFHNSNIVQDCICQHWRCDR